MIYETARNPIIHSPNGAEENNSNRKPAIKAAMYPVWDVLGSNKAIITNPAMTRLTYTTSTKWTRKLVCTKERNKNNRSNITPFLICLK
ncbi:MAG: hypothetical protein QF775_00465 [archaeon]|jgi:hypothetical protein|nr:hypothetical protein [archaeon]